MERVDEVVEALVGGDDPEATRDRLLGLADEYPSLGAFYGQVLGPAMVEVGERWANCELTVADEHRATNVVKDVLGRLKARSGGAPLGAPGHGLVAVVGCVEGEAHDVGARMLADMLDERGWRVHYLGQGMPARDLAAYAHGRAPHAVFLSVSIPSHVLGVRRVHDALGAAAGGATPPLLVVGGRPFARDPDLAARVEADFAGSDPVAVIHEVEARLRASGQPAPSATGA